jgi:DNA helicase-2/ATP-dependent DNA helicase PcrA
VQLEGVIGFEADKDPLGVHDAAWAERVRFKSTLGFVKLLDSFLEQMPDIVFAPADYTFGRFTAKANMIGERFRAYGKYPVKRRLRMIADDIHDHFVTDNIMEDDIPGSRTILKALNKMLTVKNSLALYKEFYKRNNIPQMLVMPSKNTLEWADVYPFLYIQAAFEGLRESGVIKHLVIDEMQDYTPVQYAVLNVLFKCQKTILGDFGQFLNPNYLHTLEDLKELYGEAEYAELTKSYRSTYEIISFAKRIKSTGTIEAVERHGEAPLMIGCRGKDDELARIKGIIDTFERSAYASLGIIAKTSEDAKQLYVLLSAEYNVHLISPDSTRFENGVTVTSVHMSKGLEFDEVIIPGADCVKYGDEYDRSLLYIACTRAMHRLTLLWTGKPSALIGAEKLNHYSENAV